MGADFSMIQLATQEMGSISGGEFNGWQNDEARN
jgi:hypothetical protein